MARIAILGWGSLVWDPQDLPLAEIWKPGGPALPIEFCRVSSDCRLTLVITDQHGVNVQTRYAISQRDNLEQAITDLTRRECTIRNRIGYVTPNSAHCSNKPDMERLVKEWGTPLGIDAVIWTDLTSNFEQRTGTPFSPEAALEYLRHLPIGTTRDRARDYVLNTPPEVDTPVRARLQEAAWI